MIVIVAGGRNLVSTREISLAVEELLLKLGADAVVSGCARGGDAIGEQAAFALGLTLLKYPAIWVIPDSNGTVDRTAGFKRNEQMAKIADALIALPGGRGTDDMIRRAKSHGLTVYQMDLNGDLREIEEGGLFR